MRIVAGLCAIAALLAGCGGGGGPPDQSKAPREEVTGVMTDGTSYEQVTANVKGGAGLPRTARVFGTNYVAGLTQLSGPYIVANTPNPHGDPGLVFLSTVTPGAGTANVTPLTTLLTAQLLGMDPKSAYNGFNADSMPRHLITDAGIDAAQAKVTAFLQDVYGVQVQSGTASFVVAPFRPVAGDPMYETILALNAKLAARNTNLGALAAQVASASRLCMIESISLTVNGRATEFCPRLKEVAPDPNDGTVLNYVFTTISNETMTVRIRGNDVVDAAYESAGGDDFSCSGPGCGIALGAISSSQARSLSFEASTLTGGAGSAILEGTLVGGNFPPPLSCLDDRFYLTLPDASVVADCVDTDTTPFGLYGELSDAAGFSRDRYVFTNRGDSPEPQLPSRPQVEVVLDNNSAIVSVAFKRVDPNTGGFIDNFACRFSACNGVTLGPEVIQTPLGPSAPFKLRHITLDNTILSGLNSDGTPTGTTATLNASFDAIYYRDPPGAYPPLVVCDPSTVSMSMIAAPGAAFNICYSGPLLLEDLGGGETKIFFQDFSTNTTIDLRLLNGVPSRVFVHVSGSAEDFSCSTDCAGIVLTPPDSNGAVGVTFNGTLLHQVQSFPLPGDKTLALNGGPITAAPPPPAGACNPATDDIVTANLNGSPIDVCLTRPGGLYSGEDFFYMGPTDFIEVYMPGDVLEYVNAFIAGRSYYCTADVNDIYPACTGSVTVTPPDGTGARTLTLSGVVVPDWEFPGDPSLSVTLTGGPMLTIPQ